MGAERPLNAVHNLEQKQGLGRTIQCSSLKIHGEVCGGKALVIMLAMLCAV